MKQKQELKTEFRASVKDAKDGNQPLILSQCPYCGNVESLGFDYSALPQDGELRCIEEPEFSYDMNCVKCDKKYLVTYKVELTHITSTKI